MDHHVYASIYSVDRGLLLSAVLGMLTTFPQCNFSPEFPKILDFQNNELWDTHYHALMVCLAH